MTKDRPKRHISKKRLEYNNGILWWEERYIKKALYRSLKDSQLARRTLVGSNGDSDSLSPSAEHSPKLPNGLVSECLDAKVEKELEDNRRLLPALARRRLEKVREGSPTPSATDDLPLRKRPRLHAQRKFAQCLPNSPSTTPVKVPDTPSTASSRLKDFSSKRPKTEDFLTFLCLRGDLVTTTSCYTKGTRALPNHLDLLGTCPDEKAGEDDVDDEVQEDADEEEEEDDDIVDLEGVLALPVSPASSCKSTPRKTKIPPRPNGCLWVTPTKVSKCVDLPPQTTVKSGRVTEVNASMSSTSVIGKKVVMEELPDRSHSTTLANEDTDETGSNANALSAQELPTVVLKKIDSEAMGVSGRNSSTGVRKAARMLPRRLKYTVTVRNGRVTYTTNKREPSRRTSMRFEPQASRRGRLARPTNSGNPLGASTINNASSSCPTLPDVPCEGGKKGGVRAGPWPNGRLSCMQTRQLVKLAQINGTVNRRALAEQSELPGSERNKHSTRLRRSVSGNLCNGNIFERSLESKMTRLKSGIKSESPHTDIDQKASLKNRQAPSAVKRKASVTVKDVLQYDKVKAIKPVLQPHCNKSLDSRTSERTMPASASGSKSHSKSQIVNATKKGVDEKLNVEVTKCTVSSNCKKASKKSNKCAAKQSTSSNSPQVDVQCAAKIKSRRNIPHANGSLVDEKRCFRKSSAEKTLERTSGNTTAVQKAQCNSEEKVHYKSTSNHPKAAAQDQPVSIPVGACVEVGRKIAPSKSSLEEIPTFRPSSKEFHDPVAYLESVRDQVRLYGMCLVIPPADWRPECKLNEEMRFVTQVQHVHKLWQRWGPSEQRLACIRKHLLAQGIVLDKLPLIGGCELDLARFSQLMEEMGGVQRVNDPKKWGRLADLLGVPRSAQDRLAKLQEAYCKYLLSYDTLPMDVRTALEQTVLAEKAKLLRAQDCQNVLALPRRGRSVMKCSSASSSGVPNGIIRQNRMRLRAAGNVLENEIRGKSRDHDQEIIIGSKDDFLKGLHECIFKGKSVSLTMFYRTAKNILGMCFARDEPLSSEVEQKYWDIVEDRQKHTAVYCGKVDTQSYGSGFPIGKSEAFSRHGWNLTVLPNNPGSVLRHLGALSGVTIPWLNIGMIFSTSCWSCDQNLPCIDYLHTGADKIWYCVPESQREVLEKAVQDLAPINGKSSFESLRHHLISPEALCKAGVKVHRVVQRSGQFVVHFPGAFTASVCCGYNVSEAVHFATAHWLPGARETAMVMKRGRMPNPFPLEKLLYLAAVAEVDREGLPILTYISPILELIRDCELRGRRQLYEAGLRCSARYGGQDGPPLGVLEVRKRARKGAPLESPERRCHTCQQLCYLSMVVQESENIVFCLECALAYVRDKKSCHGLKMMYRYDEEQINSLVYQVSSIASRHPSEKRGTRSRRGLAQGSPNTGTTLRDRIPQGCATSDTLCPHKP
uniref:protein Jumonji-like isoform X2 n=1 Tax=Myxine glutinosa TaxID=7769 RepID=UPI00358ED3F9